MGKVTTKLKYPYHYTCSGMVVSEGLYFLTLAAAVIGWALLGGVFIVWKVVYGPMGDLLDMAYDILGPRANQGGRPAGSAEGMAGLIQEWGPTIKAFLGPGDNSQTFQQQNTRGLLRR